MNDMKQTHFKIFNLRYIKKNVIWEVWDYKNLHNPETPIY